MSDRDRLAADLQRTTFPGDTWGGWADRLIALGWTNPWGAALADPATKAALDAGLADAAAGPPRRVEIRGMVVKVYREDDDDRVWAYREDER